MSLLLRSDAERVDDELLLFVWPVVRLDDDLIDELFEDERADDDDDEDFDFNSLMSKLSGGIALVESNGNGVGTIP